MYLYRTFILNEQAQPSLVITIRKRYFVIAKVEYIIDLSPISQEKAHN